MHLLLKKRHFILAGLVVLLSLAVFVNWYYTSSKTRLNPEGTAVYENGDDAPVGDTRLVSTDTAESFASIRLERSAQREEALENLREAASAAGEGSEAYIAVSAAIEALSEMKRCENDIESLVCAGLGSECVAVLSDNTVDVVVSPELLTDEGVLKINDIVNSVCPEGYENIRISSPGEVSVNAAIGETQSETEQQND